MNRPIIRIVATDGKAYPLAPAGVPTVPAQGTPATPFTAADTPLVGSNTGAAREAEARAAPTSQPCIPCEGQGEREWLSLDETEWRWHICEDCDGTGYAKKPYCEVCESKLAVDGWCYPCDSYALHAQAMQSREAY